MAKYGNEAGVSALGQQLKQRCLIAGKSLLTDSGIWNAANFDELKSAYVDRPDESNAKFDQKLAVQLANVSSAARQLFGELYIVDVLVLGNMLPETKISSIDAVLSLCNPPLSLAAPATPEAQAVVDTFNNGGVLNGGQGYFQYRWKQITFLILFGCAWTRLERSERERRLATADEIEDTVFHLIPFQQAQIQSALAYILAPKNFAPITSQRHLQAIQKHYAPLYPGLTDSTNPSRIAGEIQEHRRSLQDPNWDFYIDQGEWDPQYSDTTTINRHADESPDAVEADEASPTSRSTQLTENTPLAMILPHFTQDDANALFVDLDWLEAIRSLLARRKQIILEGPPGTGKTYLARQIAKRLSGEATASEIRLVQFHPAYTYEDFFEGYRPNQDGTLVLRDGPLKRLARAAETDPEHPYFLIIDEINRGNLARIFGELYFLLEYRDQEVELMYSQRKFTLPQNLFIIGTMNSADRSIALVDSAMRRRFAFVPLTPSTPPTKQLLQRWCHANNVNPQIATIWQELNARIQEDTSDPNALLGPSYFMRAGIAPGNNVMHEIWEYEVIPQLKETLFGNASWSEAAFSLDSFVNSARIQTPVGQELPSNLVEEQNNANPIVVIPEATATVAAAVPATGTSESETGGAGNTGNTGGVGDTGAATASASAIVE